MQEEWKLEGKKVQNEMDSNQGKKIAIEREILTKQNNIQDNKNEIAKIKKEIKDVS